MNKKIRLALILSFVLTVACALFIYGTFRLVKPIGFENVKENEIISGDKKVVAWASIKFPYFWDVTLEVDNKKAAWGQYYGPSEVNLNEYSRILQKYGFLKSNSLMQFSTNKFANGIRKLTLKDQKGHSATKFVRFKNIVSNTDCDIVFTTGGANGTVIPNKCQISANCDSPSCIIEILDNCNPHLVVRTYSVKSHSIRIFWDGLDNHTKEAPPGIYFIVFKAGMPPYPQVVTNKLDSKNLTLP